MGWSVATNAVMCFDKTLPQSYREDVILICDGRHPHTLFSECSCTVLHIGKSLQTKNIYGEFLNIVFISEAYQIIQKSKSCGEVLNYENFKHIPTSKSVGIFPLFSKSSGFFPLYFQRAQVFVSKVHK